MNTITSENNPSSSSGTIKSGYKKTPVGIIPEDWELKKLKDITIKIGSGSTPRGGTKVYVEDAIPFIRSQNVKNNTLDISDNVCIDLITHQEMKSTIVYPEDVLLNITGASIGRTCVVPHFITEANVSQHVCIIRLKSSKNVFIQSYLSSFEGQKAILRNQTGGNREGLNHKAVGALHIPIPPLPEQERIAFCLTTWDKGIEKLSTLIEAKKQQKKGLMQQLLTGEKRLDGFTEEWKRIKLEDLAEYRRGSFPQPYGLAKWYDDNGKPFIQVYDVDDNFKLKKDTKRKISDLAAEKSVFIPKGTLIITIQGSIGRLAITDYDAYIDRTLLLFTRFKKEVNKYFIMYQLYRLFQIEKQRAPGGTIKTITIKVLSKFTINITSLEEQNKIADVLNTADKEIELLEKKIDRFKTQKKGLMQVLLTGEKRLV